MAAKLLSIGQMVDRVIKKVTASGAVHDNRDDVLDDLQEEYDYYVAFGKQVGDSGWVWMLQEVSVSLTAGTATVQLSGLEGGMPIAMRFPDNSSYPSSVNINTDPRRFANFTYNRALTGSPEIALPSSYDPVTDLWTIRVWPVPTDATTLTVLFQRQSTELFDSYALADSVFCPPHLRHIFIHGATALGLAGSDRLKKKYDEELRIRNDWLEIARVECLARKPTAQITVECMQEYWTGRGSSPSYWGWT